MSTLKGLRDKRDAALKARHLDIPVAGLDGIVARFRPVTVAETQREGKKAEKARDKDAANVLLNATVLGAAFLALLDEDGNVLADGVTPELVEEFVPDIPADQVQLSDVMLGLFTDDFPLFKAGSQLAEWSQSVESEVDGSAGN